MKKNINYIIVVIILIFSLCSNTKSLTYGGCEYSKISKLKSLVSNINLSYDYSIVNNNVSFSVTISNLVPEIYFVDSQTETIYNYGSSINGEIVIDNYKNSSGSYKFYSAVDECYGIKLGNKYYSFPNYNYYYDTPICKENKNFSLCQKWVKVTYSYNELKERIDEYNEKNTLNEDEQSSITEYKETYLDMLVKIYIKYYYFILIGIIAICVIIILINKKKNSFDL